jgi:O-antigen/teichoic acid export membrane protein
VFAPRQRSARARTVGPQGREDIDSVRCPLAASSAGLLCGPQLYEREAAAHDDQSIVVRGRGAEGSWTSAMVRIAPAVAAPIIGNLLALTGLARTLGLEEYGRFTIIHAGASIITLASAGWVTSTIVRFASDHDDHNVGYVLKRVRALLSQSLALAFVCALVALVFLPSQWRLTVVLMVVMGIASSSFLPDWQLLRARDDYLGYSSSAIYRYIVAIGLAVGVTVLYASVTLYVVTYSFVLFASLPLLRRRGSRLLAKIDGNSHTTTTQTSRMIVRFALPLVPANIFMITLAMSDRIMVGALVTESAAGQYAAAYTVGSLPLQVLLALCVNTFGPQLTRRWAWDEVGVRRTLGNLAGLTFIVGALGIPALYLVADGVLPFLFSGAGVEADSRVSVVVAAGETLVVVQWFAQRPLAYTYRNQRAMAVAGVAALVNVLLNLWLIGIYGPIAAAWTTFTCYMILLVAMWLAASPGHRVHVTRRAVLGFAFASASWALTVAAW